MLFFLFHLLLGVAPITIAGFIGGWVKRRAKKHEERS